MLPLFVLAHFGHHLLNALPIPLLPLMRSDFSLDYTQSGLVISAFSLAYGIGQLPGGWLTHHVGARFMITLGICGVAAAGFLVGLSQSYFMLIFSLVLMGVLGGGYHPAAPPLITAAVDFRNQGRALGLHIVGGGASYFLSPLIAAAIAASWGWRGSYIGLAVPTILFGIFFYSILGKLRLAAPERFASQGEPKEGEVPGDRRRLVSFLVLSTSIGAMMTSVLAFAPLFLVDRFGISKEAAAAFYAFIYSAGLWVGPLTGYLSDRWGTIPLILGVCFLSGPVVYLLPFAPWQWGILSLFLAMGVILYVRMPVSEAFIIRHTSPRHRSTVLGIYQFGAMEGGGVLTPVMGYLIDHLGFQHSFTFAAAALTAVTLICWLFLRGHRH